MLSFFALAQYRARNSISCHLRLLINVRLLSTFFVWWIAAQGLGTSKNNASALMFLLYNWKPSWTTSLQFDVIFVLLRSSKNFLVISALYLLNSKVYKCPFYPIDSEMAHDRDPLPVPAYTTTAPGVISSLKMIALLSIAYKICVFLAKVYVIRVDFGLRTLTYTPGLLKA
jgi:hypothetical protein